MAACMLCRTLSMNGNGLLNLKEKNFFIDFRKKVVFILFAIFFGISDNNSI